MCYFLKDYGGFYVCVFVCNCCCWWSVTASCPPPQVLGPFLSGVFIGTSIIDTVFLSTDLHFCLDCFSPVWFIDIMWKTIFVISPICFLLKLVFIIFPMMNKSMLVVCWAVLSFYWGLVDLLYLFLCMADVGCTVNLMWIWFCLYFFVSQCGFLSSDSVGWTIEID